MFKRTLIACLLIASLAAHGSALSPRVQDETPAQPEAERLTPEEERDARALIEKFTARMEETGDVTPLLQEFYVHDFIARLQQDDMGSLFPLALTPEVAALATPAELGRVYAASVNVIHLGTLLYMAAHLKRRQAHPEKKGGEDEEDYGIAELVPPDVLKLISSDPGLGRLLEKELLKEALKDSPESTEEAADQETASSAASPDETRPEEPQSFDDLVPFKAIEELRHYLALMEEGLELIRRHLKSLPPELAPRVKDFWAQHLNETRDTDEEKARDLNKLSSPQLRVLKDEFMGYPQGTRLICGQMGALHLRMVRETDGALKILKAYLLTD